MATAEATIVYTGDSGPLTRADHPDRLIGLAREADLFIADSTLVDAPAEREGLVMTAAEAADWAERAGVRRLMLTHFWPFTDRAVPVDRARAVFGGEILAASEDCVVDVSK